MVCDNVTEIGWLLAQIHHIDLVVFVGGFVVENPCVWQLIATSMKYWSKGTCEPYFFEHDGYFGAIGALLADQPAEMWSKTPAPTPATSPLLSPDL